MRLWNKQDRGSKDGAFKDGATKLNHNNKNDFNYVVYDDDDASALESLLELAIIENQDQE